MKPASSKDKRILLRVVFLYIGTLLGIYLLIAFSAHLIRTRQPWEGFKAPDDTKVARELLAEKFTGPRYFHIGQETERLPHPYISVFEARRQVESILKARQLPSKDAEKLNKVIERLMEPAASRVTGGDRINTLQLNLSLDEMK